MFEELQLVQLVSFYLTSRPLGFIFWKIFHNTRCPIIPETTLGHWSMDTKATIRASDLFHGGHGQIGPKIHPIEIGYSFSETMRDFRNKADLRYLNAMLKYA